MLNEHLAGLIRSTLAEAGAGPSDIAMWQGKFEATDNTGWVKVYKELKKNYHGEIDKKGKIASFIRSSKLQVVMNVDTLVEEPPQELIESLYDSLKKGKSNFVVKSETLMTYQEVTELLERLSNNKLNSEAIPSKPHTFKLPFIITSEQTVKGHIVSAAFTSKRSIPLVTLWTSRDDVAYQYFGQPRPPKGFQRIAQNIMEFNVYKMNIENGQDAFLLSVDKLELEPCMITGMKINAADYIKVGDMAKIPASTPCYFVHSQLPEIEAISDEDFKLRTSTMDMNELGRSFFGAFRHPLWFEKLIIGWAFSAKFSGYPLHIAILSPAGIGKTFMLEGLAQLTNEDVASGSNDTLMGLVPSFGNGIAREGYLASRKRFGFIDEFFAMVRKSARNMGSGDVDSGTYMMLELLEHKRRRVRSGVGEIEVNPKMKVLMVSNNHAYNRMRNLVEVTHSLNYAFLSRWLWYIVEPSHTQYINNNKSSVSLYDWETHSPKYDPKMVEIIDYLSKKTVEGIDMSFVDSTVKSLRGDVPVDIAEKIYDPRAVHHLLCLIDGYAKVNSIINKREKLMATKEDHEEAAVIFESIIRTWASDIRMCDIREKDRVRYLNTRQKEVFDFIEGKMGCETLELSMALGNDVYDVLVMLEGFGLIKSVENTNRASIWYPYWAKNLDVRK